MVQQSQVFPVFSESSLVDLDYKSRTSSSLSILSTECTTEKGQNNVPRRIQVKRTKFFFARSHISAKVCSHVYCNTLLLTKVGTIFDQQDSSLFPGSVWEDQLYSTLYTLPRVQSEDWEFWALQNCLLIHTMCMSLAVIWGLWSWSEDCHAKLGYKVWTGQSTDCPDL